eukprot:s5786_g4.t1
MEPKITAPSESAANLWRQRAALNAAAWSQTRSTGSQDLDDALWQATLKDASSGWALLLPAWPASSAPPDDVLLSRRFAVVQSDKDRGVDDFSFSGLNDTLGTCEKVTTMSTVHTTALGLRLLRIAKARGMRLLGRCFDLKSAYRQLPIHLDDLPFAAVTVWSPDDQSVRVLQMFALLFGAGGSVPGFVRVSLALWRILCRLALVPATLFFDDYTCMVLESDAANAEASVRLLFRMLGWKLALEGDKAASFAQLFQLLGGSAGWQARFSAALLVLLRVLLSTGRASRPHTARPLSGELAWAIRWILEHIPKGQPRVWSLRGRKRLHLFTDGAFESGSASIGGVLCDGWCRPLFWFGSEVPSEVTSVWCEGGVHPIIQAELLATAVALHCWSDILSGSNTCAWVDNEVVRFGVINGFIRPESAMCILDRMLHLEATIDCQLWVCRVPSCSNPADGPSKPPAAQA